MRAPVRPGPRSAPSRTIPEEGGRSARRIVAGTSLALLGIGWFAFRHHEPDAPPGSVRPDVSQAQTGEPASRSNGGADTADAGRYGRGIRIGAVVTLAVAAGLIAWLVIDHRNGSGSSSAPPTTPAKTAFDASGPAVVTVAQLRRVATSSVPIYWAGPRVGTRVELTRTSTGSTFIRYLPAGAQPGSRDPYLTVATYARPNGFREVKAAAAKPGALTIQLAGGGIAVYTRAEPKNMHIAYPSQPYQIEVFSPQASVARELTVSGAIRPAG